MTTRRRWKSWQLWLALSLVAFAGLAASAVKPNRARSVFLPGTTTNGHYQIELACESCHTSSFSDAEQIQSACERCHAAELKRAEDSHPRAKFTDPRNADRVSVLDARRCVTCHTEHNPRATGAMAVTLPEDYCFRCHQDIAEERPSHEGMPFDSCADVGCHNFHDNRALYEDYLVQHLDEPALLERPTLLRWEPSSNGSPAPLDAPSERALAPEELTMFQQTSHAAASVNCSGCHGGARGTSFHVEVSVETCQGCHEPATQGWLEGRHGMRKAAGLGLLFVGQARAPTHPTAHEKELDCQSCHRPHVSDRTFTTVAACLSCHADEHSRNYERSKHHLLGLTDEEQRVSCATCHLPVVVDESTQRVSVEHNQNDNLRPREKMIRGVCANCHGMQFVLSALADERVVQSNFAIPPRADSGSLDLVRKRVAHTR